MNAFLSLLEKHAIEKDALRRGQLTTLQVNLGDLCNQSCRHCHVSATPHGTKVMSRKVVNDILRFVGKVKIRTLDVTGGAPELNPHFDHLITGARPLVEEIIVRSNLTVFFEAGKEYLPGFFKQHRVHLICSLPCYGPENVDRQRGAGVFEKSVKALQLLNEQGFSRDPQLLLDLVYNPQGASLPGPQDHLEREYKTVLQGEYQIHFNRLLTITNVAINKFKEYLQANDEHERYYDLLKRNFNPRTIEGLMCRSFLSVGFDGRIYDCDFNLALGIALKDEQGRFLTIDGLELKDLKDREVLTGEHCLSCTAGSGSSCQGALATESAATSAEEILPQDKKDLVKEYYGKVLRTKDDLKTSACCATDSFPEPQKSILKLIEPEILERFYGCGSPVPPCLEGCTVLDLGSGTGRDVYVAAKLAGEDGFVIGVDMTEEQLTVARRNRDRQMARFGFNRVNVDFRQGFIEDLASCGIADNSVDVVISNCVINLSPDKRRVFAEIFRVLKPGGELLFADVFADRRVPDEVKADPLFYGECLGGAMYIEDFRRLLREVGCPDYRVLARRPIVLTDPQLNEKAGPITFYSMTVRAFKLAELEDICEDYGQVAYYQGTIPHHPHAFVLDDHHVFVAHKPLLVCGNTAAMVARTRYGRHFKVTGDTSRHFGPFPCGTAGQSSDAITFPGNRCC